MKKTLRKIIGLVLLTTTCLMLSQQADACLIYPAFRGVSSPGAPTCPSPVFNALCCVAEM